MNISTARKRFQSSLRARSFRSRRDLSRGYLDSMIRYRPNVAIILRREDGQILIGERSDIAGAWQFPQGGVNKGETILEALHREVLEEISLSPSDYHVTRQRGPYRYEYSDGRTKEGCGGQEQTYFLADFVGDEARILADPSTVEFQAMRWIEPEEFQLEWVAPMKREVYRAVLRDFFDVKLPAIGKST